MTLRSVSRGQRHSESVQESFLQICKSFSKNTENFKQETLVKTFLGKQYEAHNALADVRALQELFEDYCRCVAG